MNEAVLGRVRALLAKAESTEFPAEAEAFNQKAIELIARHGIDYALLAARGHARDEVKSIDVRANAPYAMEKASLLQVVARAMRCEAIVRTKGRAVLGNVVVGHESDLERVNLIYTSLLIQAAAQVVRQHPDDTAFGFGERTITYRKSWFVGFIHTVQQRFEKVEREAARASSSPHGGASTELVLRDRSALVRERFVSLFPEAQRSGVTGAYSGDGYVNGHAAGTRANLGQPGLGGRRRTLERK